MRFLNFHKDGEFKLGLKTQESVLDVETASSMLDAEVNAANDNIQQAAAVSLKNSDIMPQIPEWPEVGDLLASAIQNASTGGDVDQLMKDAAKKAERILRRAGYF